jgi:hypothetical protein
MGNSFCRFFLPVTAGHEKEEKNSKGEKWSKGKMR